MANLTAASTWDNVLQLETTDQAIGGAGGTMNKQAQSLLNRTQYLEINKLDTADFPATLKTNINASGTAPIYAARSWVNFNGTGTIVTFAAGNITSITDNNVGEYTLNFTTAFQDANYAVSGICANSPSFGAVTIQVAAIGTTRVRTASAIKIQTKNDQGGSTDVDDISVIIFR